MRKPNFGKLCGMAMEKVIVRSHQSTQYEISAKGLKGCPEILRKTTFSEPVARLLASVLDARCISRDYVTGEKLGELGKEKIK